MGLGNSKGHRIARVAFARAAAKAVLATALLVLAAGLAGCGETAPREKPPEARAVPKLIESSGHVTESAGTNTTLQHGYSPDGRPAQAPAGPAGSSEMSDKGGGVVPPPGSPQPGDPKRSGSASDAAAGSGSAAGSAAAGCDCGEKKAGCKCGHCSGVIGECHCRH